MKQQCKYVNQKNIRCGQPEGHYAGHGNGLLTTPRDEWTLPKEEKCAQVGANQKVQATNSK